MSDRTKGFLGKMGIDTQKSVSIKKVVSRVAKDRRKSEKDKADKQREKERAAGRKVPGFDSDPPESNGVPGFGIESDDGDSKSSGRKKRKEKFDDEIMERVQSTFDRYDRNKDGSLDKAEMKDARWGSPPPERNDTNRDGKLSRTELAARYRDRETARSNSKSSSSRPSSSRGEAARKSAAEKAARDRRERERSKYRSKSPSTSSYSRKKSSTVPSSTVSADTKAKYQKYAKSLIKNYDKDSDGKLSKDELKQMRRPPAGADMDKDGFVSESELRDSLSGANKKQTTTSSTKQDDKPKKRFGRKGSSSSKNSSGYSGSSSSFDKLDADANRKVEMHEFSTKWDDKKVKEFYEKDKNNDGVISLREWTGR